MRNIKRTMAIVLVLILALAQVAFAADVTTVNGNWLSKTPVSIGGMTITSTRIKFQDGGVLIQLKKGSTVLKSARGTYTVADNKISVLLSSSALGPIGGTLAYEIKPATKTKPERIVAQGTLMGVNLEQTFNREAIKVCSSSYTKVKRAAVTKLKIKTTSNADFVIVYDKDGLELGRSETRNKSNAFSVPLTFAKKTNTVYAYAGMYGVDGKVQLKDLSAKKKITVYCK